MSDYEDNDFDETISPSEAEDVDAVPETVNEVNDSESRTQLVSIWIFSIVAFQLLNYTAFTCCYHLIFIYSSIFIVQNHYLYLDYLNWIK